MSYCPFKMANPELADHYDSNRGFSSGDRFECDRGYCALWNERFGMCSFAVDAYLKGQEDARKERDILRKGG